MGAGARIPSFLLSNIRRLISPSGRTKSAFLKDLAESSNALLVGVTETWLHSGIFDSEVTHNFAGYSLFRSDREGRDGGGVALYLREDLIGDVLTTFDNGVCELLVVNIPKLDHIVAVIYRPPDTKCAEFTNMLNKLDEALSGLPAPTPTITLMGDLNLPQSVVKWVRSEDGHLMPVVSNHREGEMAEGKQDRLQAQRLVDFTVKHSLIQQVDQATHGVEILDLIFTNDHELVSSVKVEAWDIFTDHRVVTATVTYQNNNETEEEKQENHLLGTGLRYSKLDFNKAPWEEIQDELNTVDWGHMEDLAGVDPTAALAWLQEKLLSILERLVPARRKVRRKSGPQMNHQRRILWRKLAKVKGKIKSSSSVQKLAKLLRDRWELERQLADDYTVKNSQEEDKAVFNMKTNSKAFYAFARSRQKTRSKVGPFMDPDTGELNLNRDFSAKCLSEQYSSVFSQPRPDWDIYNLS